MRGCPGKWENDTDDMVTENGSLSNPFKIMFEGV